MTAEELIAFEKEVAAAFEAGHIGCPVHLSGGNEQQLIEIFKDVAPDDWVLSTWRSHYHALLHGIPRARVMDEIMAGRSMNLAFPDYRFLTSAIVGGMLPIAVGIAAALKRRSSPRKVWCFVGDMCMYTGIYGEASLYAENNNLPLTIITEDNGFSADTPTLPAWGHEEGGGKPIPALSTRIRYKYERTYPHYGVAKSTGGM